MKHLLLVAILVAAPDPAVETACPKGICTIPAEKLQWLLDAHNAHVEEIRDLKIELRDHDCNCFTSKLREA